MSQCAGSVNSVAGLYNSLGPLTYGQGALPVVVPAPTSPVIGAIPYPTTLAAVPVCPATDELGQTTGEDAPCNIGALQTSGPEATAEDLYVDGAAGSDNGDCTQAEPCGSIQTALTTATGLPDDVTVHVAAGTYTENDTVSGPFTNTVTIQGAGQSSTFINGSETGSVLTITYGSVTVTGVTIENGNASDGGGINACNGTSGCAVTVTDSTFTGNSAAARGGGIDLGDSSGSGTLSVSNTTFVNNSSGGNGGAIDSCDGSSGCTVTVTGSTFTGNSAQTKGGSIDTGDDSGSGTLNVSDSTFTNSSATTDGGAIDSCDGSTGCTTTVSGSTFSGDSTQSKGGAIDTGDNSGTGTLDISDSTFSNDSATDNGGAIDSCDGSTGCTTTVSGSTFSGDSASSTNGGAIDNGDDEGSGSLAVTNSTFAGNVSGNDGGAIDNGDDSGDGTAGIISSTFWGNWVGSSGQGAAVDNAGGTVDLAATILAAAPTTGPYGECAGSITDEGYDIDDDGWCALSGTGSISDSATIDNTLGALKQNQGLTPTILPDSNSPAVGAIPVNTTVGLGTLCPTTDQQGVTNVGPSCNMGATQTTATTPTISAVTFSGTPSSPTVTVTGSGFGTQADLGTPVPAYGGGTGSDYGQQFYLLDGFGAGEGDGPYGDALGVSITSYSNTQVVFTFGSGYATYGPANSGDSFSMNVLGTTYNGTVEYTAPVIDGVTFGGDPTNPTVTVTGTGLGSPALLGTPTAPGGGGTGSDYSNNFSFTDGTHSWQAGQGGNFVGLIISSYTDTQVVFTFGSEYSVFGPLHNGDSFSMGVLGTTFNGTVELGTGYTCTVSGLAGTTSFPLVESESPAPPSSIDVGGTFSVAPAAQVTIPASVINAFIANGATSLTVAYQTTSLDGRSSVGGSLSGALTPNTQPAGATNLPQSDATLVADTPYTYNTTYNPLTYQAGPGTGKVYLTPGPISAELTFVIHGNPTSESLACTPPPGVAALGSTTVKPAPVNPTYQVPSSTPPLENQVSAGTDGGWGATIANTSKASVNNLTATVHVTDGLSPLTFDLTGMSASGTNCASSGSGTVTCSVGSLGAGASDTLDLLVNTTGLANGTTITGTATVTSGNAGSGSTTLGSIGVVVIQAGNGTKAVAAPGIPLASTKRPLRKAKAKVTLTLPKKATKKAVKQVALPFVSAAVIGNQPPVAVTLQSLTPASEPALCPPTGATQCEGDIVEAYGNFAAYTSNLTPITAEVQFFYGNTIPSGTVYFLKPNGKTVDKLALCKKTVKGYDTPCLATAEQHLGTTGNKYAQDTIYFTGNDPVMGRR